MTQLTFQANEDFIQFRKGSGIVPSDLFAHLISVLGHEEALFAFMNAFSATIHDEFDFYENRNKPVAHHVPVADKSLSSEREDQLKEFLELSGEIAEIYHRYFPEAQYSSLAKIANDSE